MTGQLDAPGDKLFEAAVDAIKIGLEDFEQDSRSRKTAAIRNLYAGILLLCKHLLVKMAPTDDPLLLIAAKTKFELDKGGAVISVAVGRATIGANEIIERFEGLEVEIDVSHLKILQRLRNEIEHYFSTARDEEFDNAFVEVQLLVSDLLSRTKGETTLGPRWTEMVARSKAFEKRRDASRRDLEGIEWISGVIAELVKSDTTYIECQGCGSSHLARKDAAAKKQQDVTLKCLQCAANIDLAAMLETMLDFRFFGDDHEAAKGGEIFHVYPCPECEHATFVSKEEQCANCGAGTEDYSCEHCGEKMPIWAIEAGNPYCSDECAHIAYQISKDD